MILAASLTVQCDDCQEVKTFEAKGPIDKESDVPIDDWFFSGDEDLCPECHKRKWG